MRRSLFSEDDLARFEGWLEYQGLTPSTPVELEECRVMFDESSARSSATPKAGLMKLKSVPGQKRYAVAVREGDRPFADLVGTLCAAAGANGIHMPAIISTAGCTTRAITAR